MEKRIKVLEHGLWEIVKTVVTIPIDPIDFTAYNKRNFKGQDNPSRCCEGSHDYACDRKEATLRDVGSID